MTIEKAGNAVPITLFAGPRGAGKSRAMLSLLDLKRDSERWTLVVEEIGKTMPDPAVLSMRGVAVRGTPYGCPCCSGNLTMRISLARALRETRPHRILFELPWGAHLARTLSLFSDPLLAESVSLAGLIAVLDAGKSNLSDMPDALREALTLSTFILLNGTDIPPERISTLSHAFPGKRIAAGTESDLFRNVLEPQRSD